ncbi:MAG: symmetrical bis(5'-nucleosyl)-tetraphosphatase [Gammaproteobacteria bacterium]|nr:symmetrical bis(5'-nucleosyl)-tetraphosphatase [Gammaproteobacteria bacterium]
MSHYAIGDLQGCYAALEALLAKINYDSSDDILWFTGDLVNRGPDSLNTLRLVSRFPRVICVLGNHDLHLLALALATRVYPVQHNLDEILNAPDRDELIHWLRNRPLLHHDSQLKYTMTHAGIPPQWSLSEAQKNAEEVCQILQSDQAGLLLEHMYGNEPDTWSPSLQGWDRLRYIINAFTRMRFCDPSGKLILDVKGPAETQTPHLIPWFQLPNKRDPQDRLIFGHWAALMGKTNQPNLFALDTGCVWGNQLTAMRLEDQKLFSVECAK